MSSRCLAATLVVGALVCVVFAAPGFAAEEVEYIHYLNSSPSKKYPKLERLLRELRAQSPLHSKLDIWGEPNGSGDSIGQTIRVPDYKRNPTGDPAAYTASGAVGCGTWGDCLSEGEVVTAVLEQWRKIGYCERSLEATGVWRDVGISGSTNPPYHSVYVRVHDYIASHGRRSGGECVDQTEFTFGIFQYTPITPCTGTFSYHMTGPGIDGQYCREQTLNYHAVSSTVSCCAEKVGNPINVGSGAKLETITDYRSSTLEFTRHYNSLDQTRRPGFGPGWTHNWNRRLILTSGDIPWFAAHEDGNFTRLVSGGTDTWISIASDRPVKVMRVGVTYQLLRSDGYTDVYGNTTGRLNRVLDPSGRIVARLVYRHGGRLLSVTDGEGRVLNFEYDESNRLARVIDPSGGVITYHYDANHTLVGVTRPDGTAETYHYEQPDMPGMLTGISDGTGTRVSTFAYDSKGRANLTERAGGTNRYALQYLSNGSTRVTDPAGGTTTYNFVDVQGARRQSGTSGASTSGYASATYNSKGFLTRATDHLGSVTTWSRDSLGRETSRTEASGTPLARTTTTQWHTTLNLPVRVTEPGRITEYTYQANGLLLSETITDTQTGATRTTSHTYDAEGRRIASDGPRTDVSDVMRWEYDAAGNIARSLDALGRATSFTYDAHGNPLTITDPNGTQTELTYDANQRLLSRRVAGAETRYEYDASGQLTRSIQPDGSLLAYTYDAAQRLIAVSDGAGNRIEYTLDARGQRIEERTLDPQGTLTRSLQRAYDSKGQLASHSTSTGTTAYTYDAVGNRLTTTDPLARTTSQQYDALRRLSLSTDAAQGVTRYAYDARGNLVEVIDPRGVTTRYTYDGFDQVTRIESADAGTTVYTYDTAGNRVSQTDARGLTTTYAYDAAGRLTAIRHADPALDIHYTWDSSVYGIGRLGSVTDGSGRTDYAYDARGNVVEERRQQGSATLTTRYAYDLADRIVAITWPSGARAEYPRDATGRVQRVTLLAPSGGVVLADGLAYEPFGPLKHFTDGAGREHARAYDLDGRVTRIDTLGSQALDYGYDAAGNLTALNDLMRPSDSQTFAYDALDRLTRGQGGYGAQDYAYDAVGNRRSINDDGSAEAYAYGPDSNRLLAVGTRAYQYDAAGNTLDDGRLQYTYDARNRLSEVHQDGTRLGRYAYNALGQRVQKIAGERDTTDYAGLAAAAQALADQQMALATAHSQQADAHDAEALAQETLAAEASAARQDELILAGQQRAAAQAVRAEAAQAYAGAQAAADAEQAQALAAEARAAEAALAAEAASLAAAGLTAEAGAAQAAALAKETEADALVIRAAEARVTASAQEAYALDQREREAALRAEAATLLAQAASLRADAAALLAEAEPELAKARMFRARIVSPEVTKQDAVHNRNWIRQAEHFEGKVAHLTGPAYQKIAEAEAKEAAAANAVSEADAAAGRAIQATLLAIALREQATADDAQALVLRADALALHAEATQLFAEAAAQEDLALQYRDQQGVALAEAAAHQATATALRAGAETALAAAEQEAVGLDAQADAALARADQYQADAEAASLAAASSREQAVATRAAAAEAQALASTHQAEADRLLALAQNPPNTEQVTLFVYDGAGHLLGEYAEDGSLIREHVWLDGQPIASYTAEKVYLIQTDHLNTPVSMTDLTGAMVWRATREPFGETTITAAAGVIQNLRFPGQYYDQETGLHQNWNREYDPGLGRYTQSDPIELRGGPNVYLYVGGSPAMDADPSGLSPSSCFRVDASDHDWSDCYLEDKIKRPIAETADYVECAARCSATCIGVFFVGELRDEAAKHLAREAVKRVAKEAAKKAFEKVLPFYGAVSTVRSAGQTFFCVANCTGK